MKGSLLDGGEGKGQTPAAAGTAHLLRELGHNRCSAFLCAFALVYAGFVLCVTHIYTHSWIDRLQMLPLCIVAVIAPMLWASIMLRKYHG